MNLEDQIRAVVREEVARALADHKVVAAPAPAAYVDDRAVAVKLGISRSALQAMRRRGEGPRYFHVARRAIRYSMVDVDAWVAEKARNRG